VFLVDSLEELIEEGGAFGLFVFAGVVALTLEGGPELDGGRHARLRLRAEVTDPKPAQANLAGSSRRRRLPRREPPRAEHT